METDNETNSNNIDTLDSTLPKIADHEPRTKSINLLKRSKRDLLRLLCILEGELEARDIVISTLHAQLSNQRNARQQYYIHRLTDPFLSLHRDDYLFCIGRHDEDQAYPNELAHMEPLPLLENVVCQFKSQQQKMHQQMALASKLHRKMACELAEEKHKHAIDTKTGDDVTMALEKERERLKANVMCERKRTKRIETEYKKLLALCKEEGRKHKMIVMELLAEQERLLQQLKLSRTLQIDIDSTETELKAKLHEALNEKQNFAMRLKQEQVKCNGLTTRIANFERHAATQVHIKKSMPNNFIHQNSVLEQATALYSCGDEEEEEVVLAEHQAKTSENPLPCSVLPEKSAALRKVSEPSFSSFFLKHHPMSVAQSTQDVTLVPTKSHPPILLADGVGVTTSGYYSVKPGSTIAGLEAMKSLATSKDMLSLDFMRDDPPRNDPGEKLPQTSVEPRLPNTKGSPKPNRFIPGSPYYIPFRSPHSLFNEKSNFPLASSPTSGAANFAMNSPNSPTPPPSSPFSVTYSPSVKASSKFHVTKFEPPTKLKGSSSDQSPAKLEQNFQFLSTKMRFQNPATVKNEAATSTSKENVVTEKRFQGKKFTSVTYKSYVTQKVAIPPTVSSNVAKPASLTKQGAASFSEEDKNKQPLPPKTKPFAIPTNSSSQMRPPPLPPKKPSLPSGSPAKRPGDASIGYKTNESSMQRKTGNIKREARSMTSPKANPDGRIDDDAALHRMTKETKVSPNLRSDESH